MNHPQSWPLVFTLVCWAVWFCSWIGAAVWSKRTEARPERGAQRAYSILVYFGFALLVLPTIPANFGARFWIPPLPVKWLFAALAPLGFGLAWWARVHLGRHWSWNVTRKEDHRLVDTGPYAVVRHPIYTGVLMAAIPTAVLEGKWPSLIGFVLLVGGLWVKAGLEERFLASELSDADYRAYIGRSGKLLPRLSALSGRDVRRDSRLAP